MTIIIARKYNVNSSSTCMATCALKLHIKLWKKQVIYVRGHMSYKICSTSQTYKIKRWLMKK